MGEGITTDGVFMWLALILLFWELSFSSVLLLFSCIVVDSGTCNLCSANPLSFGDA